MSILKEKEKKSTSCWIDLIIHGALKGKNQILVVFLFPLAY